MTHRGTDLIAVIERLGEESGVFGGLLTMATEWGTREQVLHSYELVAREEIPHFRGSLVNLPSPWEWIAGRKEELNALMLRPLTRPTRAMSRAPLLGEASQELPHCRFICGVISVP